MAKKKSSTTKPRVKEDRTRALLELLYHVSREVATALDLRTVLQRVLFEAIENVGGERGSIVVLDDFGQPVDSTIVYGAQFHEHTTQQLLVTVEHGLAGWVVKNRKPALVNDTSKDERWLRRPDDDIEKTGSKSAICVPLLAREKLVGVLTLVHSLPEAFDNEHLELMQAIADQAGIAVLNARLYTESQRQARVMTALAEGAEALSASLRLDDVLQRVLNQTMQALQVETVALGLIDPGSGEVIFRSAVGNKAGEILNRRIPAGEGLVGTVITEGQGIVISDVKEDKRFSDIDQLGGMETRSAAIAPIQAQGKVIGVLEAINPVTGFFDQDSLLVMNGIGSLAGTNIQNAQLFEKLEEAHQRYLEFFETSIDPILITDWEGKILEANRQASLISLYSDEELRSMEIDQVHEVDWEKTGENFEHLREYHPCTYQALLHKRDGHILHMQVNVRIVNFEETEVLQWTLHDISERRALDELRSDLTAMVYHDLRSPLANIISSLDILGGMIDDEGDESIQSILKIASNSTTRIERLVNSLLDINRLELGQSIANQTAVNLEELVLEAMEEVRPATDNRNQTVASKVPGDLPHAWVDKDMILRVIINLLENGSKFTPSDGKITIEASQADSWLTISVEDTGPGIPVLDQERIFDKFIRLRGQDRPGGLGIGLAFCKMAAEGHGGKIWVESQMNIGTTFQFTLPIASEEQLAEEKGEK